MDIQDYQKRLMMEAIQRDQARYNPPVPPGELLGIARENPIIASAMEQFFAGRCRYEEALAIAVKGLHVENQRLKEMNLDLLNRMPPGAVPIIPREANE